MKVIGITAKSGTGKSTFAKLLAKKLHCKCIDIDKIGHNALIQPYILNDLINKFGSIILDSAGNIDRKKLGDIVFCKRQEMQKLTEATEKYIYEVLDNTLSQNDNVIILDWILLPHTKYWEKCNFKILITADEEERKRRVMQRDNISEEYFCKRDLASIDYSPYKFDYIFKNDYRSYIA